MTVLSDVRLGLTHSIPSVSAPRLPPPTHHFHSEIMPLTPAGAALSEPPDGGYGYVVMASSFLGQFLTGTILVGFGTIMVEFAETFETSQAKVAIIGAVAAGVMNFSGRTACNITKAYVI